MKKILIVICCMFIMFSLVACNGESSLPNLDSGIGGGAGGSANDGDNGQQTEDKMSIRISDGKYVIIFVLNDSSASKSLYSQLPFSVSVSNYADNEKIFYPPNKLDTSRVTGAQGGAGTLAYFSPWDNVVIYYGNFGAYNGLYSLGNAVSNIENIKHLSGTILLESMNR